MKNFNLDFWFLDSRNYNPDKFGLDQFIQVIFFINQFGYFWIFSFEPISGASSYKQLTS